jgi:hypothetical protein
MRLIWATAGLPKLSLGACGEGLEDAPGFRSLPASHASVPPIARRRIIFRRSIDLLRYQIRALVVQEPFGAGTVPLRLERAGARKHRNRDERRRGRRALPLVSPRSRFEAKSFNASWNDLHAARAGGTRRAA